MASAGVRRAEHDVGLTADAAERTRYANRRHAALAPPD